MNSAPVGQVTLVFTDVQASTILWDRAPRAMKRALVQHDQVLRSGIQRFRGYEVKTEGDAFMVAFRTPVDAVNWCLEVQLALHETDWPTEINTKEALDVLYGGSTHESFQGLRVRMGVHTGRPECRENHRGDMDYFGSDVNEAARLCDAGHGGQILMSLSVSAAIKDADLGPVKELGDYMLRGFHEPKRIIQILPSGLQDREFPPLRGVEEAMPSWPGVAAGSATPTDSSKSSAWSEAPVVSAKGQRRLAVLCSEQFPLDGIRNLSVKHDLRLVRLESLDGVQAEDILLVDGGDEAISRLEELRQLDPVWHHCFWVSFHEPNPPVPGVERISPLDPVAALEQAIFGTPATPQVVFEEPLPNPPWLEEHRPETPGFQFNKSAVAVILIWAVVPAFYWVTAEPPLDVELPVLPNQESADVDHSLKGTDSNRPSTMGRRAKANSTEPGQGVNPLDSKGVQAAGTRETTSKETNKEVAKRSPVTLFKTAYCPACRGVSCLLDRHQIPYKALDLDQDKAAQAAFPKSLLGSDGSITVPVLQVGSQRVQGYKRSEILRTLGQVGYSTGRLGAQLGEAGDGGACKNFKKNELENWTRPRFSVLGAFVTDEEKRRAKQPMPFDVKPMSRCLKKLSKKGKRRLAKAKKLSVTLRMGIMGDGRIVAVSVKKLAFGSRRYKRRKVSRCIEGAVVGQTFPLRPKREPEFLTRTYKIP
ncbi:MAG: adenylate/guanylate cyclase domain-containing protein [Myxococcota bacterium]|nr:adenylate/guanylate cyclase domain-containing protein [Myxococcota bacterium]